MQQSPISITDIAIGTDWRIHQERYRGEYGAKEQRRGFISRWEDLFVANVKTHV